MKITKKLVACLSAFAVVSVATVGFATWLVGVTQNSQDVFLTAQVDDVKYNETAFLEASIAQGTTIAIAEKEETPRGETTIVGTSTDEDGITVNENALKFSFESLTVRLGKNLATKPTKVKVVIDNEATTANQVTTNTMTTKYRPALSGESYWTYLASNIEIPFDTEGEDASFSVDTSSDPTFDIYTLTKKDYELSWGTFFGGDEPTTFYNGLVDEQEFKELLTMSTNAYTELAAMNSALAGKTITLTVSLDYKAA